MCVCVCVCGLFFWQINQCSLSKTKSGMDIYIRYKSYI